MSIRYQWQDLDRELNQWQAHGLTASFWWRDDDATTDTEALAQLLQLSVDTEAPLSLAVIPGRLEPDLPHALRLYPATNVLLHGWLHTSHAPTTEKKSEYPVGRSQEDILAELSEGRELLQRAFGTQFVPVLVPPWNRYDPALLPLLQSAGLTGISAMWARTHFDSWPLQVNTHIDPVAWRGDRGFVGVSEALEQLINHLRLRRECSRWYHEPTGLLTHHLDHDAAVWQFCQQLIEHLQQFDCVRWTAAGQIWSGD